MKIEPPDESREITTHCAEHEIFLSFNDDIDAELFSEWWNSKGWTAFKKWGEKEKEKRQIPKGYVWKNTPDGKMVDFKKTFPPKG